MVFKTLATTTLVLLTFLTHGRAVHAQDDNPCSVIRCEPGFECDPLIPGCVPVSCDVPTACEVNEECVPKDVVCVTEPCPQFECKPQGCATTCGEVVPFYQVYFDDGENYCRPCICLGSGEGLCSPWDCPENPTLSECPLTGCTTTCGRSVDVGDTFQDDGTNFCNTCTCEAPGQAICTLIFCDPDAPEADCDCVFCPAVVPECEEGCEECEITPQTCDECAFATCLDSTGCTTTCGRSVDVGDVFQDDGTNFCNTCTCEAPGQAICTEIACDPNAPEAECDCVICPAVVPECEEGCEECEITPDTCDACAVATCVEP